MEGKIDQTQYTIERRITPKLLETTREIIEGEQQSLVAHAKEHEDPNDFLRPSEEILKWDEYFNNWHDYLPGSYLRSKTEELGLLDHRNPIGYPGHTNLIAGKTQREIDEAINKAVDEAGLDRAKIKELMESIEERNTEGRRIAFNKYTFPAFVRLRAKGYNQYDLTA